MVAVEIITKAEEQQLLDQEVMIVEEKQPQEDKLQEEQLKEEEQLDQLNKNHVTVQNMNPIIV